MDSRGVKRLLEKTYGLADTATTVGAKSAAGTLRETRLTDKAKVQIAKLYGEEALRLTLLYAGLGLAMCRAVEGELEDNAARSELEAFRSNFQTIYDNVFRQLKTDFPNSAALTPD